MSASQRLREWLREVSGRLPAYQNRELAEIIKQVEQQEEETNRLWHQLNPEGMGR